MHELHLIRIEASDHKEATSRVNQSLSRLNEGVLWYCICGSICSDGSIHVSTSSYKFTLEGMTLERLDRLLQTRASEEQQFEANFLSVAVATTIGDPVPENLWSLAARYCDWRASLGGRDPKTLDPWRDTFRPEEFTRFGLTDMADSLLDDTDEWEESDELQEFIVFVDMCS